MSFEITKGIAVSDKGTMSDRRVFYTFLPIRLGETFRLLNNEFGSIDLSIKLADTKKK